MRRPSLRWIPLAVLACGVLCGGAAIAVRVAGERATAPARSDDAPEPVPDAVLRGRAVEATSAAAGAPPSHDTVDLSQAAFSLSGRVTSRATEEGLGGIAVQAVLTLGDTTESLGRATTGPDGRYALALPRIAEIPPLARRRSRITVWAVAAGHVVEGVERTILLRLRPGPHWTADLVLRPAFCVSGRVVDEDGRPVPFATVRCHQDGAPSAAKVRTDEQGRYVVSAAGPVLPGTWTGAITLDVRVAERGVGRVGPIPLADLRARGLEAPPVVVRGAGVLSGVATFPDGTPAADVQVRASLDRTERRSSDAPGLPSGETWTDAEGRFALAGLRPGRWAVAPAIPEGQRWRVSTSTADGNVRLVVGHPRVRVLVRDEAGRPLPGAEVCVHRVRPDGEESWSAGPVPTDSATISWWEPPGTALDVAARLPGGVAAEASCTVPADTWTRDVVLTLREPPRPWGHVRVRVLGPDATPIEHYRASVRTPRTRFHLEGVSELPQDDGRIGPVPPGRWRLAVGPGGIGLEERGFWFPEARLVDVFPGRTTDVEIRPRIGGRVRVLVRTPTPSEESSPFVRILRAEDDADDADDGDWVWPSWGEGEVSDVLVPGPWIVRPDTEGFSGPDRTVQVVAGEVVDVELELVRD